jgi:hypothetical protein
LAWGLRAARSAYCRLRPRLVAPVAAALLLLLLLLLLRRRRRRRRGRRRCTAPHVRTRASVPMWAGYS